MASYAELHSIQSDAPLKNKVKVAITIASDLIRTSNDTGTGFDQGTGAHDARYAWVKNVSAYDPSDDLVQKFWNAMLAANESVALATIQSSSDTSIQNNVNAVVDILARGET